jgi:hypothetical protein
MSANLLARQDPVLLPPKARTWELKNTIDFTIALGAIYEQCLFCGPSHLKLPSIGASVDLYNAQIDTVVEESFTYVG